MKKYFAILSIYDGLMRGLSFGIKDIEDQFGANRRTCFRYIHDIKEYMAASHPDMEILYSRKAHSFRVIKRSEMTPEMKAKNNLESIDDFMKSE